MSNEAFSFELSTKVAPAKKFAVDGEPFQMLGIDHLSDEDDAIVSALFARHNLLCREAEGTSNIDKGKQLAGRIRKTRIQILCKLTDMPTELAEKLPVPAQVRILEALQEEMDGAELSDEAEDNDLG